MRQMSNSRRPSKMIFIFLQQIVGYISFLFIGFEHLLHSSEINHFKKYQHKILGQKTPTLRRRQKIIKCCGKNSCLNVARKEWAKNKTMTKTVATLASVKKVILFY
jgi:hypothetical protein